MVARCIQCASISELGNIGICSPCIEAISWFKHQPFPDMWRIERNDESGVFDVYDGSGHVVLSDAKNDLDLRVKAMRVYEKEYEWTSPKAQIKV